MNIILIGFMGSGKSSVARRLAEKLQHTHVETDSLVLSKSSRRSIKEIFELDGELKFREMEIDVAKQLQDAKQVVVSTGGGMIINRICIDYLRKNAKVVFLDTSFKEIVQRLSGDTTRPLFNDKKAAHALFQFRKKLYRQYADKKIITDKKSIDEIISIILKTI